MQEKTWKFPNLTEFLRSFTNGSSLPWNSWEKSDKRWSVLLPQKVSRIRSFCPLLYGSEAYGRIRDELGREDYLKKIANLNRLIAPKRPRAGAQAPDFCPVFFLFCASFSIFIITFSSDIQLRWFKLQCKANS